jgi:sialate O-acetylesterase
VKSSPDPLRIRDRHHRRNNQDVTYRLALAAAKLVYGENVVSSGPTYQSMRIERNRARITFADVATGLLAKDAYGCVRAEGLPAVPFRMDEASGTGDAR